MTCNGGYKLNTASDGCDPCPLGQQSNAGFTDCVACTSGTNYRSSLTQTTCISCPSNAACATNGFTCNAGYEPTGDGLGCSLCFDGYSKSIAGNTACSQCPIGTESAANRQTCTNCAAGYYRSSLANAKCIACPTGATCSTYAISRCQNGSKINLNADGCEQCPIGQDSGTGVTCVGCNAGFFKPDLSYQMCAKCPDGSPSCGGSLVSCQVGYYFDSNVQCKRNDTYFAMMQTGTVAASTVTAFVTVTQTSTSTTTSTSITSLYLTATAFHTQMQYSTQTKTVTSNPAAPIQTMTVTSQVGQQGTAVSTIYASVIVSTVTAPMATQSYVETVTVVSTVVSQQQQPAQSGNSVTLDNLGTLPISPLIFGIITFSSGVFVMLVLALVCCRKSRSVKGRDEESDTIGTTTMNTTSHRTFTSNTASMR